MSMNEETRERIFEALVKWAPISIPHLAQKLHMLPPTINWQVRQLHKAKRVYVHSFSQQKSKTHTRIWAVGNLPDAVKAEVPEPEYDGVDDRRLNRLTEEQIESIEESREARRRQALLKEIKPFRDEMIWVLFGGVAA